MLPFGLHLYEKRNRSMHNVPRNGVTSQQTFQRCFNVVFWLTRRRDVGQRQINILSSFTMLVNVETTL